MKKQEQNAPAQQRDHLFISYATEDWPFVEWLALRLTAEGYKVWCDRFKLLGGESYPQDIDEAIKSRTFRFLAILSRHSVKKPNPLKERTLALNLAKERKENFVIPINLDGLSPNDLDWMLSDLTFISFHLSWAEGLAQLLKQLEESDAPRSFINGRSAAASWFDTKGLIVERDECLWSNVALITELPTDIYRYEIDDDLSGAERLGVLRIWPHSREDNIYWSFDAPPAEPFAKYRIHERGKITDWETARSSDIDVRNTAVRVLNDSLRSHCLMRGLKLTPDNSLCYFPDGLLQSNRLTFVGYDKERSWLSAVGIRNFKTLSGKESCRYHLAPAIRVWLGHELGNLVELRVRLHLTTTQGVPLDEKTALRRRKKLCRNWWNYEWLSRTLAIFQFLAGEDPVLQIGKNTSQRMVISKLPIAVPIGWSLDESQIGQEKTTEIGEMVEDAVVELDDFEADESEVAGDE